jgi:hypothetical protein
VAGCQLSVKSHRRLAPIRRFGAWVPTPILFSLLATDNRLLATNDVGGLFSVTLSVTRDSHPKYPRFHKACCPSVFGLSSGEKFTPAITCHSAEDIIEEECVQRSALNVQRSAARHIGRGPPGSCASPIELELELGFSSAGGGADGKQPRFQRSRSLLPFAVPGMDSSIVSKASQCGCLLAANLQFRMKLVKYVLLFRSDFPGFSGEIVEKSLLRGVGKLI